MMTVRDLHVVTRRTILTHFTVKAGDIFAFVISEKRSARIFYLSERVTRFMQLRIR